MEFRLYVQNTLVHVLHRWIRTVAFRRSNFFVHAAFSAPPPQVTSTFIFMRRAAASFRTFCFFTTCDAPYLYAAVHLRQTPQVLRHVVSYWCLSFVTFLHFDMFVLYKPPEP